MPIAQVSAPESPPAPLRVAALSRYGELGASSRVRMSQYAPALAAAGGSLTSYPLLGDDYLRRKYATGRTAWPQVMQAYAQRAGQLLPARQADVLWVEKELWPWAPAWVERWALAGKPVVLDFDDAIFHLYDQHRRPLVRRLWGHKIDRLMRSATLVTAGNAYLAERARAAGARWVELLPTVIDLDRYPSAAALAHRPPSAAGQPLVIGWIGSPSTVHYLQALARPLAQLAAQRPIELRVIGAQIELPGVKVVAVPWTEAGEVAAIAACDIGIMPLPDSPWERGKCGYKLIQYMACGLPVVASPVGVNCQIVSPGDNGLLADNDGDWLAALTQLADAPALRTQWGTAGRARAQSLYSLQANAPRLIGWLRSLAGPPRTNSTEH